MWVFLHSLFDGVFVALFGSMLHSFFEDAMMSTICYFWMVVMFDLSIYMTEFHECICCAVRECLCCRLL